MAEYTTPTDQPTFDAPCPSAECDCPSCKAEYSGTVEEFGHADEKPQDGGTVPYPMESL